ncbi:MAG: sulfurtransferase [Nitrospirae bacterium]|nr:sulfurtransferase [Nitrospirota bacterium]
MIRTSDLASRLGDPHWVVFDCRHTLTDPDAGRRAYAREHVPAARFAHMEEDLSEHSRPGAGRHPLPDPHAFAEKLGRWGVGESTQVVVYDDSFGSMAVRMWWMLRWLGHEAVALLDGGLPKWKREGRPLTADPPEIFPTVFAARPNRGMWASAIEVGEGLAKRTIRLVDARSPERYHGEKETIDPVAGHVPGAVNQSFEENLSLDGTFLPPAELREACLSLLAGTPPENVIQMCGSGVTACHNLLAMEIAGLKGARLYPGSWSEWIADPLRPLTRPA